MKLNKVGINRYKVRVTQVATGRVKSTVNYPSVKAAKVYNEYLKMFPVGSGYIVEVVDVLA